MKMQIEEADARAAIAALVTVVRDLKPYENDPKYKEVYDRTYGALMRIVEALPEDADIKA